MSIVFNDLEQSKIAAHQRAELWMRLYPYAAEDFVSIPDNRNHATEIKTWGKSIESRLNKLGIELERHEHPVVPHIHDIPHHTHTIAPHFHVAPPLGGPTSPMPLVTMGNTLSKTLANPTKTKRAYNSSALKWKVQTEPQLPKNTTMATPNLKGNKIISGTGLSSEVTTIHKRRMEVIPILNTPIIPPLAQALMKSKA